MVENVQQKRQERLIKLTQKVTPLQINSMHKAESHTGDSTERASDLYNKRENQKIFQNLKYPAMPPGKKILNTISPTKALEVKGIEKK